MLVQHICVLIFSSSYYDGSNIYQPEQQTTVFVSKQIEEHSRVDNIKGAS